MQQNSVQFLPVTATCIQGLQVALVCIPFQLWQSQAEIENYSVAYFDCIAAPYHWTSVKCGAHTCFVDAWISNKSTKYIWAPPLMEVQRYGASKVVMWGTQQNELWFLHRIATLPLFVNRTKLLEHCKKSHEVCITFLSYTATPSLVSFVSDFTIILLSHFLGMMQGLWMSWQQHVFRLLPRWGGVTCPCTHFTVLYH